MAPTHSRHNKRTTAKNSTRLLKPAINLRRPEKGDKGKHDEKINCRTIPGEFASTTYKIPMAYFRDGTPKTWPLFNYKISR